MGVTVPGSSPLSFVFRNFLHRGFRFLFAIPDDAGSICGNSCALVFNRIRMALGFYMKNPKQNMSPQSISRKSDTGGDSLNFVVEIDRV